MKKLVTLLFLLILSISGFSQTHPPQGDAKTTVVNKGGYIIDSIFRIPVRSLKSWTYDNDSVGRITYDPITNKFYFHDNIGWKAYSYSDLFIPTIFNTDSLLSYNKFIGYNLPSDTANNAKIFMGLDSQYNIASVQINANSDLGGYLSKSSILSEGYLSGITSLFRQRVTPYEISSVISLAGGTIQIAVAKNDTASGSNISSNIININETGVSINTSDSAPMIYARLDSTKITSNAIPNAKYVTDKLNFKLDKTSAAGSIQSSDISNWNNKSTVHKPLQIISTTNQSIFQNDSLVSSIVTGVTINGSRIQNTQYTFNIGTGTITLINSLPFGQDVLIDYANGLNGGSAVNPFDSTTSGFVNGKNLLFPNYTINSSYVSQTGTIISLSTAQRSDYIPVLPNTIYTYSGYKTHSTSAKYIAEYDINKTLISSTPITVARGSTFTTFTTLSNCAFLRATYFYDTSDSAVSNSLQLELGGTATSYQIPNRQIVSLRGLHIRNADSNFITSSTLPSQIDSMLVLVPGKNLVNPLSINLGHYISAAGTVISNATAACVTNIPIIGGNIYTLSGLEPHASLSKYIAWYDSSHIFISSTSITRTFTKITLTAPSNAAYTSFTMRVDYTDSAVSNSLQLELGGTATSYQSYVLMVNSINGFNINSSSNSSTLVQKYVESYLEVFKSAGTILVRSKYNNDSDMVQTIYQSNNNGIAYLGGTILIPHISLITSGGTVLSTAVDNTPPIQFSQLGNIGGGHGVETISTVATAHTKTISDIGSIYTDGTYQYYLTNIVDANNLTFLSLPVVISGEIGLRRGTFSTTNATLTYVSGGINTSNINTGTCTSSQNYPSIKNITQLYLVDSKSQTADSDYYCNNFEIRSIYTISDPTTITPTSSPFIFNNGGNLVDVVCSYRFSRLGGYTLDWSVNFNKTHYVRNMAFLQQQELNLPTGTNKLFMYMPDVNQVTVGATNYNLAVKQDMTTLPTGYLSYLKNTWQDTTKPPSRLITTLQDNSGNIYYSNAMGVNINYGTPKPSIRKSKGLLAWEISNFNKSYPYTIGNILVDSTVSVYGQAYSTFFDPKDNPLLDDCYLIQQSENVWVLQIDCHILLNRYIVKLPTFLAGKSITIIDSNNMTLVTDDVVPSSGIIISCPINTINGNYLTLKLANN